ncbi:MAG: hypothetical protein FJ317_00645 [SAR202 cluster bacterium]|nr:hypothetical protein [SAR202 cluster bacterium]
MTILWLVEWMIRPLPDVRLWLRGGVRGIRAWVTSSPFNWAAAGFGLLMLVFLFSTVFSASPAISVWGRRPGGDDYSLYTVLGFTVVFLTVATRLRTQAQVTRLLSVIAFSGVLVGAYGISQRFGFDPWLSGIQSNFRSISSVGNAIFAAAVLMTTILATLTLGLLADLRSIRWPYRVLIGAALSVQLLGIIYTLSRGPWVGLAVSGGVFGVLILTTLGTRAAGRTAMLALSAAIASLLVLWLVPDPRTEAAESSPTPTAVVQPSERVFSLYSEVVGGGVSDRIDIWRGSISLAVSRPWPTVAPQHNSWARHILGYGPDTYRYVYPLRAPEGPFARFAFEAHNVILHAWVELGILGALAVIGAGIAVLYAVFSASFRQKGTYPYAQKAVVTGLAAFFVGRFAEMMVGVPKVADLTLLAMFAGLFVAVPHLRTGSEARGPSPEQQSPSKNKRRDWAILLGKAAVVWVAVVALGVFTWERVINYARADGYARAAVALFNDGATPQVVFPMMDTAIDWAPDVIPFRLVMAELFESVSDASSDADFKRRTSIGRYVYAKDAVLANPLDPDARTAELNAALALFRLGEPETLLDIAVERSESVVALLPNFAISHYDAALTYLQAGKPEQALVSLEKGDTLVPESGYPDLVGVSEYYRGLAYRMLGDSNEARAAFERSLATSPDGRFAANARRALQELP